jgi:hypothetical protein
LKRKEKEKERAKKGSKDGRDHLGEEADNEDEKKRLSQV